MKRKRSSSRAPPPVSASSAEIMSASHKVFNTYELVEHIMLKNLSIKDILQAQRISRFFKEVIADSMPLQRATFQQPLSVFSKSDYASGEPEDQQARYLVATSVHPAIRKLGRPSVLIMGEESFFVNLHRAQLTEVSLTSVDSHLVCQPPCDSLQIVHESAVPMPYNFRGASVGRTAIGGNTIGELLRAVKQLEARGRTVLRGEMPGHAVDGLYRFKTERLSAKDMKVVKASTRKSTEEAKPVRRKDVTEITKLFGMMHLG